MKDYELRKGYAVFWDMRVVRVTYKYYYDGHWRDIIAPSRLHNELYVDIQDTKYGAIQLAACLGARRAESMQKSISVISAQIYDINATVKKYSSVLEAMRECESKSKSRASDPPK